MSYMKFPVLWALGLVLAVPLVVSAQVATTGEVSYDGLHKVKKTRVDGAWVKPDADFASYSKIIIEKIAFSYKRQPRSGHTRYSGSRRSDANFELYQDQSERFTGDLEKAFAEALSNSGYQIVEDPGPDVMRLEAEMLDVIIKVPTDPAVGRERIYVRSFGEATLVTQLHDSESGEILARVVDRQSADAPGAGRNEFQMSMPNRAWSELNKIYRKWATSLAAGLEKLKKSG
ncbi:MAG: DUF3313 family protein [Gammaproteobacteria bacterium]